MFFTIGSISTNAQASIIYFNENNQEILESYHNANLELKNSQTKKYLYITDLNQFNGFILVSGYESDFSLSQLKQNKKEDLENNNLHSHSYGEEITFIMTKLNGEDSFASTRTKLNQNQINFITNNEPQKVEGIKQIFGNTNFFDSFYQITGFPDYKYPWPEGEGWWLWDNPNNRAYYDIGGWHLDASGWALDYLPPLDSSSLILSAAPGTVSWTCEDIHGQSAVKMVTSGYSEELRYYHLDKDKFYAQTGNSLSQGEKVGYLRPGSNPPYTGCNLFSTGIHLHFGFPSQNFTIDGDSHSVNYTPIGKPVFSSQDMDSNISVNYSRSGEILQSDSVTSSVTNTGGTNISKVEFYKNGNLENTDTNTPFEYTYSNNFTVKDYVLTTKIYDTNDELIEQEAEFVFVSMDNCNFELNQWCAEYYNWVIPENELDDRAIVFKENSTDLNKNWGSLSPSGLGPNDYFTAVFKKQIYFSGKEYRMNLNADNGVKVIVDGSVIFEGLNWEGTHTQTINFLPTEGLKNVEVYYYEGFGDAYINLDFEEINNLTLNKTQRNLSNGDVSFSDSGNASIGDNLEFKITVSNITNGVINNLNLTDVLPSSFDYVPNSCSPSCSIINDSPNNGETTIVWNITSINQSSSTDFTFNAELVDTILTNTIVANYTELGNQEITYSTNTINLNKTDKNSASGEFYFISADDSLPNYNNKTKYNTNYNQNQKFKDGKVTLVIDNLKDNIGNELDSGTCTFELVRHPRPYLGNVLRTYTGTIENGKCEAELPSTDQTVNYYHVVATATKDGTPETTYEESRILVLYVGGV